MMSTYLVALLICGIALSSAKSEKKEKTPKRPSSPAEVVENALRASSYCRFTPPGFATGQSTTVQNNVYISRLFIEERSMTAQLVMYYRQQWTDARLRFNATRQTPYVQWPTPEQLWRPDTFFGNVAEPNKVDHTLVRISPNGTILFVQRVFATFMVFPANTSYTVVSNSSRQLLANGTQGSDFVVPISIESFGYMNGSLSLSTLNNPIEASESGASVTGSQVLDCTQTRSTGTYPCLEFRVYTRKRGSA